MEQVLEAWKKNYLNFKIIISIILINLFFLSSPVLSNQLSTEILKPRNGVSLRVIIIKPDKKPKASIIFYVGGKGKLGIRADGTKKKSKNFLIKALEEFAYEEILIAVFDAPSDRKSSYGMVDWP